MSHPHNGERKNKPTAKAFIDINCSGGQLQLITSSGEKTKKDMILNYFSFCSYYWHICAERCVGVSEEPAVICACTVKCNVKKKKKNLCLISP